MRDDEFPFFKVKPDLAYLDTAATSQKPLTVATMGFVSAVDASINVHRGLYKLAYSITEEYEVARAEMAAFIGAPAPETIVWTRGTTDSLNLVASSFGPLVVHAGDEILVSAAEHHSNFIPWQQLAQRVGARFVIAPVTPAGDTDVAALLARITPKTKIVAVAQVTNVTGGIVDVRTIADAVHAVGGVCVVDGAQSVPHMPVSVTELDADFFAFSGHKAYGPTGIGVLYGRADLLDAMPPIQFGGEMIDTVTDEAATWAAVPLKFEAGTPPISEVFEMRPAVAYLRQLDWAQVAAQDHALVMMLREGLQALGGVTLYGTDASAGIVSFNLDGVHPHDVATILDEMNVAVRAGDHCAQPLMARLGIPATVRASFGVYTNRTDVKWLLRAVKKAKEVFHGTL